MSNSRSTIAKNTIYLYLRLLLTTIISLYTSRIVLQALGVEDYGLYNVVGSVVTVFSFLNSGMIQASQRFMSYEMGKDNKLDLKRVFTTTMLIHVLIAVVTFILVEAVGVWFLNNKLNIAQERMYAANWVFHLSLLSFSVGVLTVPFYSAIISHEKMGLYAITSFVDALLKLGIVFIIKYSSGDRLIFYAVLLLLIPLFELFVYATYCKFKFEEVSFRLQYHKDLFRRILSFAGWSFVGNMGHAGRNTGVNVVINMLCGVSMNTVRGIAYQVSTQIMTFASNFLMAIVPQITKRFAANDISGMLSLTLRGSKLSFILLYMIVLPFYLRAYYVLSLWLGQVPNYSVEFVSLVLVTIIIDGMAIPLGKAIDATGDIKWFQICIACVMLLDVPISYLILLTGVNPYYVVISSILVSLIALGVRILIIKKKFEMFSIKSYLINVIAKCIEASMVTFGACYYINRFIPNNIVGLLGLIIITIIVNILVFSIWVLDHSEKSMIKHAIFLKLHINKKNECND